MSSLIRISAVGLFGLFVGCSGEPASESTAEPAAQAPEKDLHTVIVERDLSTVQRHLASGTSVDLREPMGNGTPLITACAVGDLAIVNALLAAGPDLEAKNNDGSTALQTAAFMGYVDIVQALVDAGANKYVQDQEGQTPAATASLPWDEVKPIYDLLSAVLAPALGIEMDYEAIKAARPRIAEILK